MTYRSIEIEKGIPGYAGINPKTNTIYISYPSSNLVIVVDLEEITIKKRFQLICPDNISVNSYTNKVYVSSAYGICEIDSVTNQYDMINIGLPNPVGSVDINPQTNLLYTTCFGHNILTAVDLGTRAIAGIIPVGENPKGVAVDVSANKVYVANYDARSVSVIDSDKLKLIDKINIPHEWYYRISIVETIYPSFLLVNPISKLLYVKASIYTPTEASGNWGECLLVIDLVTHKEISRKLLPSEVEVGFTFNHINNEMYVLQDSGKEILRFDAFCKKRLNITTSEEASNFNQALNGFPYFDGVIITNPITNKIYVSDSMNSQLYEIDC